MTRTTPSSTSTRRGPRGPGDVNRRDVLRYAMAGMGLAALGPMGRMIPVARGAPRARRSSS